LNFISFTCSYDDPKTTEAITDLTLISIAQGGLIQLVLKAVVVLVPELNTQLTSTTIFGNDFFQEKTPNFTEMTFYFIGFDVPDRSVFSGIPAIAGRISCLLHGWKIVCVAVFNYPAI